MALVGSTTSVWVAEPPGAMIGNLAVCSPETILNGPLTTSSSTITTSVASLQTERKPETWENGEAKNKNGKNV
jgi:hypothetical protein